MIELILPGCVVAVESFDDPDGVTLFPEEEAVVARAVERRRREYATVRHCARAALSRLGVPPVAILPGERGSPLWPDGIVGSMTHCEGYRAAALARTDDVYSIGIDAEPDGPLPDGVIRLIARPEEREWLADLATSSPETSWDKLVFSAKESVYKAWFPLARRFLDFQEATLTLDPASRTFQARLLVPGPLVDGEELTGFTGHWLVENGLVVTAITFSRH